MTASQTITTATNPQENDMNASQKECFKNYEWIPEADLIRARLEEEDYEGVQEIIESLIETKAVQTLRSLARDLQFENAEGLVTHRKVDEFQEEIEYMISHIHCNDRVCQGEERAKFAASFGDWNLMIKGGEYFFQHSDPNYTPGKLTMIEPMIVEGRAQAIFTYNALNIFYVPMPDDKQKYALMEDTDLIGNVVFEANQWLGENSKSFDK